MQHSATHPNDPGEGFDLYYEGLNCSNDRLGIIHV
jgi:hypothetical protein